MSLLFTAGLYVLCACAVAGIIFNLIEAWLNHPDPKDPPTEP
jgi:hypothetical protein